MLNQKKIEDLLNQHAPSESALRQQEEMISRMQNTPSIADVWGSHGIYKHILGQIHEFEQELDAEHELGIGLHASGGGVQNVLVENIIAIPPNLIVFKGKLFSTGDPVRLIQHIQQVNLLLVKIQRQDPQKPKRPIGFSLQE